MVAIPCHRGARIGIALHRIAVAVAVWAAMEAAYARGWGEGYAHGLEDCGK